jgi:hypothetical protein
MTPTGTAVTEAQKAKAKIRVFDIDKFEKVSLEREYTIPAPVTTVKEAVEFLGNDQSKLLSIINIGIRRAALLDVKKAMKEESGGVDTAAISKFIAAFRMLPKFAKINPENVAGDKRKEQTQAIYNFIKANPSLLDELKSSATEEDDENDTPDEPEE